MPKGLATNGKAKTRRTQLGPKNGASRATKRVPRTRRIRQTRLLGRYIVADPKICHGQPTFRGTRIMVWQVMDLLAKGMSWDKIIRECHNSITPEAIAEAIRLSGAAFRKHASEFEIEPIAA